MGQVECSDGTFYSLRATVHGKLVEVNESLGKRAQSMVEHATWEGFLALFMLAPKAKTLLSVEDRRVEGSEAERDSSESRQVRNEEEGPAHAAAATPAATTAMETEGTAPAAGDEAVDAQVAAQREGRAWQSVIEYLTPQQYQEKRKALFVPT